MAQQTADWVAAELGPDTGRVCAVSTEGAVLDEATLPSGPLSPARLARAVQDAGAAGWLGAGPTPVLACGPLAGVSGAREVPCTPLPERPAQVSCDAANLALHVVPELHQASPLARSMGAETRAAGFLSQQPNFDGVLCVAGARATVWLHVSAGEIVSFRTFLTGTVCSATIGALGLELPATLVPGAFDAACSETLSRPEVLTAVISEAGITGGEAAARASTVAGALVGAEVAAARRYWLGQSVVVLGDGIWADVFVRALGSQSADPAVVGGAAAGLAGLGAARAALARG